MKMIKFEKRFVNRKKKAEGNIKKIQSAFQQIETEKINTVFVNNYGLYTTNDIKAGFEENGFKTLFQERLAHGPLRQHHFILQLH